jgi:uncharacterized protein (TIGR02284 family)
MNQDILDGLKSLHTSEIDARNGYEEALVDAEGKGLSPLFLDMVALHDGNARAIADLLVGHGQVADSEGSFMSLVNRAIMSVRSLFDGLGEGVLPGLIDGERRNVEAYDAALKTEALPADVADLLAAQRGAIVQKIRAMEMQRAA